MMLLAHKPKETWYETSNTTISLFKGTKRISSKTSNATAAEANKCPSMGIGNRCCLTRGTGRKRRGAV